MLETLERDIATLLVEEYHLTIHQALDLLYESETYAKMQDPSTGLYFQSPRYVLSILSEDKKIMSYHSEHSQK